MYVYALCVCVCVCELHYKACLLLVCALQVYLGAWSVWSTGTWQHLPLFNSQACVPGGTLQLEFTGRTCSACQCGPLSHGCDHRGRTAVHMGRWAGGLKFVCVVRVWVCVGVWVGVCVCACVWVCGCVGVGVFAVM